jgi:hypothetical protein
MTPTTTRTELAAWDRLIGDAVREPNPALSNLKVTRAHYLLSLALHEVVGTEAGANFHTWAVWGSRKAGVTIRQQGLDRALREVTILALCTGLLAGFLLGLALSPWLPGWVTPALSAVGAAAGAWTGRRWLAYGRRRAAELMLAGNRTVLEDIGGQTARFVTWFAQSGRHDPAALRRFLDGFPAGRAEEGGRTCSAGRLSSTTGRLWPTTSRRSSRQRTTPTAWPSCTSTSDCSRTSAGRCRGSSAAA